MRNKILKLKRCDRCAGDFPLWLTDNLSHEKRTILGAIQDIHEYLGVAYYDGKLRTSEQCEKIHKAKESNTGIK